MKIDRVDVQPSFRTMGKAQPISGEGSRDIYTGSADKGGTPSSAPAGAPSSAPDGAPRAYVEALWRGIAPEDLKRSAPPAGAPPREGTKRPFWRWDFSVMPPGFKKLDATCRAVGPNSYIFVEDACWGSEVKESDVAQLQEVFERRTPGGSLDPGKGIFDVDRSLFGAPPDAIDKDSKVYLFLTNLGNYQGMGFDGYFNAFDEMPDSVAWEKYRQHSNEVEILYLNCGAKDTPISSDYMKSVTSHEFQHMIHFNHDGSEESWLNESCSEAAMTATGFFTDGKHLQRYCSKPSSPLVVKDFVDYGACLLWGTYLLEQLGPDFFPPLVANVRTGAESITDTLGALQRPESFPGLFDQWVVANFAASRGVQDPRYSYRSFPVPPMKVAKTLEGFPGEFSSKLEGSGVDYVALPASEGKRVRLTLEAGDPGGRADRETTVQLMRFEGTQLTVEKLDFSKYASVDVQGGGELVLALSSLGERGFSYRLKAEELPLP